MAKPIQIGEYNATHKHGEPMKNLIAMLKARKSQGSPTRGGPTGSGATHDRSLDMGGKSINRANAPMGSAVSGVQMYTPKGQPMPAIPPGVTPTKPTGAVQGSDSLTGLVPATGAPAATKPSYPGGPDNGRPVPRRKPRRLPSWMMG